MLVDATSLPLVDAVPIAACVAGAALGPVLVYAMVSFVLMQPHVPKRPLVDSLLAFGREVWVCLLTQPWLWAAYLFGRASARSHARPSTTPIVFVHGYMQNRIGFVGLFLRLRARNLGPLFAINYPWFASLESNAERLERFIEDVCQRTGAAQVDLVCHSMGGLVAVELTTARASKRVRRCVTIASPHGGVTWQGPIVGNGAWRLRAGSPLLVDHARRRVAVATLSIFSTHDNIVHPAHSSRLAHRGGRDVVLSNHGHFAILFAPETADHIARFLLEPDALTSQP